MGALANIKDYVTTHSYKEDRIVKRIKGSLYQPSYFAEDTDEFIEGKFETVCKSAFTSQKLKEKNAPGWRPGSIDDLPYE